MHQHILEDQSHQKTSQHFTTWHRQVATEAQRNAALPTTAQATFSNVDLQSLMQQLRLTKPRVTLGALFQESFLGQVFLQVAIALSLLCNAREWQRLLAGGRRVVISNPDLDVVWQAEQLAGGMLEGFGAAAREIAVCDADVGVGDESS
jgi:hypothetical protein